MTDYLKSQYQPFDRLRTRLKISQASPITAVWSRSQIISTVSNSRTWYAGRDRVPFDQHEASSSTDPASQKSSFFDFRDDPASGCT